MIAGSSSLLAIETLGYSSGAVERNVAVDVVGDADAYLGLTEDGLEDGGVLFDGESREAPASFAVTNGLHETVQFELGLQTAGVRLAVIDEEIISPVDSVSDELKPGEHIEVAIVFDLADGIPLAGTSDVTTLEIDAGGPSTTIESKRELRLESTVIAAVSVSSQFAIVVRKQDADHLRIEEVDLNTGISVVHATVPVVSTPLELVLRRNSATSRDPTVAAQDVADDAPASWGPIESSSADGVAVDIQSLPTGPTPSPAGAEGLEGVDSGQTGATADELSVSIDPDTAVENEDTTELVIRLEK